MPSTNKRKLSTKTLSAKCEALKNVVRGVPKKDVATDYVYCNTLLTWLKNKKKIVVAFQRGNNRSTQKFEIE